MKNIKKNLIAISLGFISCNSFAALDTWQDTPIKQNILQFVEDSTNINSESFIPVSERIAVFDHDGTLWNEKPLYVHFSAVFEDIQKQLKENPELKNRQPWKSFANGKPDLHTLSQLATLESQSLDSLVEQLVAASYSGMATKDFDAKNEAFLKEWKHPKYKTSYKHLSYEPMIEFIDYLKDNQYQVYIVTADEAAFIKPIVSELYNVSPSHVIGSSVEVDYVVNNEGTSELIRTGHLKWLNNWANKPKAIQEVVGQIPVIAVGNSNGDEHMLEYTGTNGGLSLWLHHTDEKREDKYDHKTEKLQKLQKDGIIKEIDMKEDWTTIWRK